MKDDTPDSSGGQSGGQDYEVSDDDYTNDYSEVSSKRRRRDSRSSRVLRVHLMDSFCFAEHTLPDSKWQILYRRETLYVGRQGT